VRALVASLAAGLILAGCSSSSDETAAKRGAGGGGGSGSSSSGSLRLERVVSGLDSPLYVTTEPGETSPLYVVLQVGEIVVVEDGAVRPEPFLDIRDEVASGGEQGLLSFAFDPDYRKNRRLYVDYTDVSGNTRVIQYKATEDGRRVDESTARGLLEVDQPYANHNGGQLAFDGAGRLYVGMGDGGTPPDGGGASLGDPQNHAQDLDSRLGKLLRIDPLRAGAEWQIVGLGLRNPWRFSFDRRNGNLWIGDVGAGSSEEIDRRPKRLIGTLANYGWSHYEGRLVYNSRIGLRSGKVVGPVYVYSHGASSCGVIGGYVYRGARMPVARGRYFLGDLCTGVIWGLQLGRRGVPTGAKDFAGRVQGLSSFGEDARGELYATSLDTGAVYRLAG